MKRAWPLACVLLAALVFLALPITNARETNADAAVVGLQAMHALRGEHALLLWGSGYQTSVDAYVAAIAFAILGAGPRALMLSSIALHLAVIALAWSAVARRVDGVKAAWCAAPVVFASCPVETYVLYPPREASIAIAVLAAWTFDRAADAARGTKLAMLAAGGALAALACFADPYALVLLPPVIALGVACAIDRADDAASNAKRIGAAIAGLAIGFVPFAMVRSSARAQSGPLTLTLDAIGRSARLLVDPCLPWTVGGTALEAKGDAMTYAAWDAPVAVRAIQIAGGTLLLVAIVAGGACIFDRRIAWPVRRLAIAGASALPVTIAGFLASPMVMDAFSARYLVSIVILAPLALAPIAARMDARRLASLMVPCAIASGLCGWRGLGPMRDPATSADDEDRLTRELAARGIDRAMADYWAAYRITFLTKESLVVVPTNPREDRYAPYRASFEASARVAYVHDPRRSREDAAWIDGQIASHAIPFARDDSFRVGRFAVTVLRR